MTDTKALREIANDFIHPRAATSHAAKEIASALLMALDVVETIEMVDIEMRTCSFPEERLACIERKREALAAFRAAFPKEPT